jgi:hypothetical protein
MPSGNPCLSSSDPRQHYNDILDAIEAIESFTEGMNFEAFRTDPKTVAAVERNYCKSPKPPSVYAGSLCPNSLGETSGAWGTGFAISMIVSAWTFSGPRSPKTFLL